MALKLDMPNSNIGVPLTGCYAAITQYKGSLYNGDKNQTQYRVGIWISQAARLANAQLVGQAVFYCATPSVNDLLTGLYADLKTQPGFTDAVDC